MAKLLAKENAKTAALSDDEAFEVLSRRANVIAYLKAMTLFIAEGKWTKEIEEFIRWSEEYDLWCKMRFFRDLLHKDVQGERDALQRGPVGLLSMLPKEFTREQVRDLRIKQGMKPDPKVMISLWKNRGLIVAGEAPNAYVRV